MTYFCSVPYIYTLEVTADCNARCTGCGNVFERGGTFLTLEQSRVILERIAPFAEMIRLTGGEPTRSPAWSRIMEAVDRLGKPFVMFTNGLWENRDAVIGTFARCQALDGILVSLHGHNAEAYHAFTQVDGFEPALESIRQASRAGILVNTNTILTQYTVDHIPEVVALASAAGAQVVAFSRYYGLPIPGLTDLTQRQLKRAVDEVARLRAQGYHIKFNNNIPLCLGGQLTQACPAGDTHCTISPWGEVRLCNHSPITVGNLLTTSIQELWKSDGVRQWRTQIPEMCAECAAYEWCRAGCRANAYANHADVDPAARHAFRKPPPFPSTVRHSLPAASRPVARFSVRPEAFGFVLINRSQIIKLGHQARPLIDSLQEGDTSVAEIADRFGREALNLVGVLYDRRMVTLEA